MAHFACSAGGLIMFNFVNVLLLCESFRTNQGLKREWGVLERLGMRRVILVFPTREEWADPTLLLRRVHCSPVPM